MQDIIRITHEYFFNAKTTVHSRRLFKHRDIIISTKHSIFILDVIDENAK